MSMGDVILCFRRIVAVPPAEPEPVGRARGCPQAPRSPVRRDAPGRRPRQPRRYAPTAALMRTASTPSSYQRSGICPSGLSVCADMVWIPFQGRECWPSGCRPTGRPGWSRRLNWQIVLVQAVVACGEAACRETSSQPVANTSRFPSQPGVRSTARHDRAGHFQRRQPALRAWAAKKASVRSL